MRKIFRPYFFISCCGLLAFAPISFMMRAMKNDVVALEYPINYFISQCIRDGQIPYWFNTWGMGFPLQSNLTWGIFSTPQLAFSSLFNYDIFTLHIEFIFFILLSGWSMFYLLRKYLLKDENLAQLLSICYMLSGFMVGSTQWLLYITAAAFIPLLICSLLALLHKPSIKNALKFAVCYTMMFTSVYAALNIITTYGLVVFILIWLMAAIKDKSLKKLQVRFLLLAAAITTLLCFPCLYFTLDVLNHIERGNSLTGDTYFFNSNYLHPGALSNMVFPFSSVKMGFENTEGTMLHSYAGLLVLLLTPPAIWLLIKEKNKPALLMLLGCLLFLFASFGAFSPVRKALNLLPGYSYFRNPAIFRFYFILSLLLFLALILRNLSLDELFKHKHLYPGKLIRYVLWLLVVVCGIILLINIKAFKSFSVSSLTALIKNISYSQTLLLSAFVQLVLLSGVIIVARMKRWNLLKWVLATDLIINTLLCTPFFSVSSYSLPEVNNILRSEKGFPVQHKKPSESNTAFTDGKGNTWQNVNVFAKKVSSRQSYYGPLELKESLIDVKELFNKPLVFANDDSTSNAVTVLLQEPSHVRVRTQLQKASPVTLQQNHFPGWKVYVNGKKAGIIIAYAPFDKSELRKTGPGISVMAPAGESIIDFRYERKAAWISALLLHLIVIGFCLVLFVGWVKRVNRSSSPSSPN